MYRRTDSAVNMCVLLFPYRASNSALQTCVNIYRCPHELLQSLDCDAVLLGEYR